MIWKIGQDLSYRKLFKIFVNRAPSFAPANLKPLYLVPLSATLELGGLLQAINV